MKCPYREGKRQCTWWVSGCINPRVKSEIKTACAETSGKLDRESVKVS